MLRIRRLILTVTLLSILAISYCAVLLVVKQLVDVPNKEEPYNSEYTPLLNIQRAVDKCPYSTYEYRQNVFDCSNMANMLDDWLEQRYGYDTYIIIIWNASNDYAHAMVIANGVLIEATRKAVLGRFDIQEFQNYLVTIVKDAEDLDPYVQSEWSYPHRW